MAGRFGGLGRVRLIPVWIGYRQGPRLMSFLRKRWVLFRHPHVDIRFGKHVYVGPGFSLHAPFGGRLVVGDGVEFRRGFRLELGPEATVTIGDETRFTYDPLIQCSGRIEIGKRCMFGQNLLMVDGNHRFRDLDRPMLEQGYELSPVVLEDDVIVTTKVTIIGVRIGTRTFVGANAVVTKDIPAYTVAVGAPARPVDYFGPGEEPPGSPASSLSDSSG